MNSLVSFAFHLTFDKQLSEIQNSNLSLILNFRIRPDPNPNLRFGSHMTIQILEIQILKK